MEEMEDWFGKWWKESKELAVALLVAAMAAAIWVAYTKPSPGVSIGMLALSAGIMSLRPEMGMFEKVGWIAVLGVFATLEVRAIHRTDKEDRDNLDAQVRHFDEIAGKLTQNYLFNREKFGETLDDMRSVLDKSKAAADAADEGVKQLTGGDSYAYYRVRPSKGNRMYTGDDLPQFKGKVVFSVVLAHIGKYPIPFMNVTWFCPDESTGMGPLTVGPVSHNSVANSREIILTFPPKYPVDNMGDSCQIFMDSPNGSLVERVYPVRLRDDTWSWAMSLQRESPHFFKKHVLGHDVPREFKFPRELSYSQSVGRDGP